MQGTYKQGHTVNKQCQRQKGTERERVKENGDKKKKGMENVR